MKIEYDVLLRNIYNSTFASIYFTIWILTLISFEKKNKYFVECGIIVVFTFSRGTVEDSYNLSCRRFSALFRNSAGVEREREERRRGGGRRGKRGGQNGTR